MKMCLMTSAVFLTSFVHAQNLDEWFHQKQTKLKYIEQQIAAFAVYADDVKKGYEIAGKGWNVIDDIKHGDFDLHNDYFNSLKTASGAVKGYDKVSAITDLQLQVLQVDNAIKRFVQDNDNIQAAEKTYINGVLSNLLDKCADDLGQLTTLTTNDSLSMKEDERLRHIDDLYTDMQDKYAFARYFESAVQTLSLARAKEINNANTIQLLYGIK